MLYAIIAVVVIIIDQWVKYWVAGSISMSSAGEALIPGVLSLVNLHNDGAAFSFLSGGGARIYFIILTGVFTVAVILALATRFISGNVSRWSIVLVTAGGLSNCIDRVIYGYVQDMFKLDILPSFPVFNVADIFITVFCIIFALAIIFERDSNSDYDEEFEEEEEKPKRRKRREEAPVSARDETPKAGRKSRKSAREDEYQKYKAARSAGEPSAPAKSAPAPARQASSASAGDPFAEWERANAKVQSRQQPGYTGTAPGAAAARPAPQPVKTAPAPAPQPVKTAPAPRAAEPTDDFSLDDILAEFK